MGKLFLKTKCEPMPICFKKRSASKHLITVRVILNNWLFPGRQYWIVDNEVAFCHCFVEGWEVLTLGVSPFCGAIPPPPGKLPVKHLLKGSGKLPEQWKICPQRLQQDGRTLSKSVLSPVQGMLFKMPLFYYYLL